MRGSKGAVHPRLRIGSQIAAVGSEAPTFLRVVSLYLAFLAVMLFTGRVAGPGGRRRAPTVFGGATRNSSMWFCGERSLFGRARNRAARCRDADTG
ncbi:hypothetical protein GCM10009748_17880 [Agromyces lapidis]